MSDASQAPRLILPPGMEPPLQEAAESDDIVNGPEVLWDKKAPTSPPQRMERAYAEWFKPVVQYLESVVADDALVLDLCLEKAISVAEFNHNRGMVGIDFFPEATGGRAAGRTEMLMLAMPLAVELYKQVCVSLNTEERKAELEKIFKAALAARDAAGPAGT